jgi:hypothetical protein
MTPIFKLSEMVKKKSPRIFYMTPIFKLSEISTSYFVSGYYLYGSSDLHTIRKIIKENKNENPQINLKLKYEWLKDNHPELLI